MWRWLVAWGLLLGALAARGAELQLYRNGNQLLAQRGAVHFLTGRSLERLRSGATVNVDVRLALRNDPRTPTVVESLERFVISYDLWEEKFMAVRAKNGKRVPALLPADGIEAWCLENTAIPSDALIGLKRYVAQLEVRLAPEQDDGESTPPGALIPYLIKIFSRPARDGQSRILFESAPFRPLDLPAGAKGTL